MRTVLLLFLTFLIPLSIRAQQKTPDELKELFNDAEFFLAQEAYVDALYDYNELYNNGFNTNANINYKIGICYLNMPGQKEKSISYLLEAVKDVSKKYKEANYNQKTAPIDAWLFLGNAYRVNNRLVDAISAYSRYSELAGSPEEITYAGQQILACQTAQRYIENARPIRMINLGDSVNGPSSNFKGVISGNGRVLLYMNELPFYNGVYFSRYTENGWSAPINITPQIRSDGDQYVTSVSYDGTQLFLTREDPFNSDIYISQFSDGKWNRSVPVDGDDVNTKYWESHASISRDGKTMYFTSNRKDGSGNMDIYVSKLSGNLWGKPVNIGAVINTSLNEDTPFISDNDSLLFFSSQGHENIGGYDIFVSELDASGKWSKPVNMGYPVNTTDDDLFYYPWNNNQAGIISRIGEDSYGKEDIYALQTFEDIDLNETLASLIKKDYAPLGTEIASSDKPEDESADESDTGDIGETEKTIAPDTPPAEQAETSKSSDTANLMKPSSLRIELDPVYFDFDNFQLNEAAKTQLEKVHRYLSSYPGTRLKLIGHADARGPAEYNLTLSAKRAVVTKNYLAGLGIDPSRIETTGMGEKNFAAINSNADGSDNAIGRQLNRRVEYEIIGTENTPIIIDMTPVPENLKYRQ